MYCKHCETNYQDNFKYCPVHGIKLGDPPSYEAVPDTIYVEAILTLKVDGERLTHIAKEKDYYDYFPYANEYRVDYEALIEDATVKAENLMPLPDSLDDYNEIWTD